VTKICLRTCIHDILTPLKMCWWEHITSRPTTIKKNCSISSVRTAPTNHNLVLASPQLFLSPYVSSHPWAITEQSITEGCLFHFFPHYVLQFWWRLWISSNYTGTFYLYQQTARAVICLPFSDVTDRNLWFLRSLVRLEMSICIYLKPSFKSWTMINIYLYFP
jgi:hypothetical protein